MLKLSTHDDRGRAVRVPMALVGEACSLRLRELGQVKGTSAFRLVLKMVFNGPALVLVGTVALVVFGVIVTFESPGVGLFLLIFSPVYTSLFTVSFKAVRGAAAWTTSAAESIRTAMMRARRCSGCGYHLAGGVVEDDGCVQCPECGAAWDAKKLGLSAREARDVVVLTGWKRLERTEGE